MIKKASKKRADISWFLQATKLQAILANSCTVSTLAQQMESFSDSAFVSEGKTQNVSVPLYPPTCKSGSLLVFGHLAQGLPLKLRWR